MMSCTIISGTLNVNIIFKNMFPFTNTEKNKFSGLNFFNLKGKFSNHDRFLYLRFTGLFIFVHSHSFFSHPHLNYFQIFSSLLFSALLFSSLLFSSSFSLILLLLFLPPPLFLVCFISLLLLLLCLFLYSSFLY